MYLSIQSLLSSAFWVESDKRSMDSRKKLVCQLKRSSKQTALIANTVKCVIFLSSLMCLAWD